MKPYPTETVTICDDDLNLTDEVVVIPTKEALKNFQAYLDKDERRFYNSLPTIEQLQIALCTNPFNAFKQRMKK